MSRPTGLEIIHRMERAFEENDWATVVSLVAPDYVEEWPQSGEIIRGRENLRRILEGYPGGFRQGGPEGAPKTFGTDERWVMTPTFALVRVEGSGGMFTTVGRVRYPDGSVWYITAIREVREGLIVRSMTFFSPLFEPAEWRRDWVEVRGEPVRRVESLPSSG